MMDESIFFKNGWERITDYEPRDGWYMFYVKKVRGIDFILQVFRDECSLKQVPPGSNVHEEGGRWYDLLTNARCYKEEHLKAIETLFIYA